MSDSSGYRRMTTSLMDRSLALLRSLSFFVVQDQRLSVAGAHLGYLNRSTYRTRSSSRKSAVGSAGPTTSSTGKSVVSYEEDEVVKVAGEVEGEVDRLDLVGGEQRRLGEYGGGVGCAGQGVFPHRIGQVGRSVSTSMPTSSSMEGSGSVSSRVVSNHMDELAVLLEIGFIVMVVDTH